MFKSKSKLHSFLPGFICTVILLSMLSMFSLPVSAASNDVAGINSGTTYYIRNVQNGEYLDVYYGGDSNGTDVWTYGFNASPAQQWRVERNSDGTYILYAVQSSNNRVLDITGSNVDIWNYTGYNYQKFSLNRVTSGTYTGTYRISSTYNGTRYVVVDSANATVNMNSYGSGQNAYWSFIPVTKNDADIYTFKYGTFSTQGPASTFIDKCNNMGYNSYHLTNWTAVSACNNMKYDNIWVFDGHGVEDSSGNPCATIVFLNGDGNYNGYITADPSLNYSSSDTSISSLQANAISKEQCVLYIGCSTGVSYNGYNLVNSTFNKGAHFALGTTQTVYTSQTDKWTKKFFEKADTGATIKACIDHANYYQSLGTLYYKGDTYAKLK